MPTQVGYLKTVRNFPKTPSSFLPFYFLNDTCNNSFLNLCESEKFNRAHHWIHNYQLDLCSCVNVSAYYSECTQVHSSLCAHRACELLSYCSLSVEHALSSQRPSSPDSFTLYTHKCLKLNSKACFKRVKHDAPYWSRIGFILLPFQAWIFIYMVIHFWLKRGTLDHKIFFT